MLLNNKSFLLYCFALLLAIGSGQTVAEMYKWVDEEGTTHYSQLPPPNDPAKVIEKNYTQEPGNLEELQQESAKKMEEFKKRHEERQGKKEQTKQEKENMKALQQACEKARSTLKNLKLDRQVRKKVGDEYITMTDEQRKKDIAELNKEIKEKCP